MGGGARYPYPKEVWTPSGGWWTQPKNWKANTAMCALLIAVTTASVWRLSAQKEERHRAPMRWIPSMLWSPQAREIGIREE
ncbi:hypothetical protein IAT38_008105 [Cryptococcus sp. DSM 104549]